MRGARSQHPQCLRFECHDRGVAIGSIGKEEVLKSLHRKPRSDHQLKNAVV